MLEEEKVHSIFKSLLTRAKLIKFIVAGFAYKPSCAEDEINPKLIV